MAFEIPSFFYMQSYKKMVVCARKTGYLTFAEVQYFRGLRGGGVKALLLAPDVMLLTHKSNLSGEKQSEMLKTVQNLLMLS